MQLLIENRQKKVTVGLRRLRQAVRKILLALDCNDKEISLVLVDNEQIQAINKQYLNRDQPTNVISFSQTEGEFGNIHPHIMGDVIISVERALSDSNTGGLNFDDELDFLVMHGVLHLLGYNHENTSKVEEQRMQAKTEELFFTLKGYRIE